MRPLCPTLATANFLPSRPAEPPSGVMSHLFASWLPFLSRRPASISSRDLRSVTGSSARGFGLLPGPTPAPAGRSPSLLGFGGDRRRRASLSTFCEGDIGSRGAEAVGEAGCRLRRVWDPAAVGGGDGPNPSIAKEGGRDGGLTRRALAAVAVPAVAAASAAAAAAAAAAARAADGGRGVYDGRHWPSTAARCLGERSECGCSRIRRARFTQRGREDGRTGRDEGGGERGERGGPGKRRVAEWNGSTRSSAARRHRALRRQTRDGCNN